MDGMMIVTCVGKGPFPPLIPCDLRRIHLVEMPLPCKGTGVGSQPPYEYISNNTASTAFSASLRLMAKDAPEAPL